MADPWDAFGDDDDDDDDENDNASSASMEALALWLTQYFLTERHITALSTIRIMASTDDNDCLSTVPLVRRGFSVVTNDKANNNKVDVYIIGTENKHPDNLQQLASVAASVVVPGGLLVLAQQQAAASSNDNNLLSSMLSPDTWDVRNPVKVPVDDDNNHCMVVTKWPAGIQEKSCPWLPAQYDVYAERQRVSQASVTLTAADREACQQQNSATAVVSVVTVAAAVQKMQTYGYCVLPGLLDPETSQRVGQIALEDLHQAAAVLKQREGVDLMEPRNSTQEPAAYRELSMREDFRMDLRHGPRLDAWRGPNGCKPWTMTALQDQKALGQDYTGRPDRFLRGHPIILEIVRQTMNPVDQALAAGNWGRYNFEGRGPDGSFMDLRVGPVGAIVNLPGSADQALHADTPHLMEIFDCLPAHYINVFTPGCAAHAAVGQTALVHASHRLCYTAALESKQADGNNKNNENNRMRWVQDLVRPSLDLGDVLLFDCRILHFGLANTNTQGIERPLLYANMTQHWFSDPKNWDNFRPIFADSKSQDE